MTDFKLLKFSAEWCGPCKTQKEEFVKHPLDIDIHEIDIDSENDEDQDLIQEYKIMSIPTMILTDEDGIMLAKFTGYTSSEKIKNTISKLQETKNNE